MTLSVTDYIAHYEQQKAQRVLDRADFRAALLALSHTTVHAEYSGYGDSGDIEDISVELPQLRDFLWSLAYDLNPGFENDDGGQGTIYWDLETDVITVDHGNNYVQTDHTQYTL
jgi:hypothetical protein